MYPQKVLPGLPKAVTFRKLPIGFCPVFLKSGLKQVKDETP